MTLIRTATPADLPGIVDTFWACWTRSYTAFASPTDLARLDRPAAEEMWREALSGPALTVVADREGTIVGLSRSQTTGDVAEVASLYVHPDAQGEGLGARLLEAALDGRTRGRLWVFTANSAAKVFYARQGWRPDGVTRTQEAFGMSETRLVREPVPTLPEIASRLTSRDICIAEAEAPPACAVVGISGEPPAAAGARDLAATSATPDTWFDLASVTKMVTTVAALVLVSQGALDLDAPAGRYWQPAGDLVVRDLLTHRSGLLPWQPLYLWPEVRADEPGGPDRDAALRIALELPRSAPGTRRYSDLGFMVLGETVAQVAGGDLPTAVQTLVAEPLELDLRYGPQLPPAVEVASAALGDEVEQRMIATQEPYPVLLTAPFDGWRTTEVGGEVADGNAWHALGGVSGHAGLFATVPALLRLGEELARPHRLDPATVEMFCHDGPDAGQALGFRTRRLDDGRLLVHHPGYTGCSLAFVPGERAYAVGANRLLTDGEPVPTLRLLDSLVALTGGAG